MMSLFRILTLVFLLCLPGLLQAQNQPQPPVPNGKAVAAEVVDGDTIPTVNLREAWVVTDRRNESKRYKRHWNRMVYNVTKVYPYAKMAGDLIHQYDYDLSQLHTEKERKEYLDQAEANLKAEFEGDIRDMTFTQGHILIKLIDRQTGHTSYELIKELKNGFTAFMWQTVARIFGSDLKDGYDPQSDKDDAMIEDIVQEIEAGYLPVAVRQAKTPETARILKERRSRRARRNRDDNS